MSKIKVMDTHLSNMIAAGEVVERPSGIIKELIENSLDANSTQIEVHIKEGGMSNITVIDNGEGMNKEDLVNAFKRHSTSKIFTSADLNKIRSFGFRGEALPSIASVSTVIARSSDNQTGHEIVIDNGTQKRLSIFARNKGTTIIVENLFSKVPARLKYIKNIRYETSIILDIIQKFSLAHPNISFRLLDDEKEIFRSIGDGNLENVFYQVFGSISFNSFKIQEADFDFKIEGIFAQPEHTRANRYSLWLYINDRMIRHPKIQNAIVEGFRRHIPSDRYPIGILKIKVDPQLVDVNVHPSKWEIRLSKEEHLINLIINSLEENLGTKTKIPKLKLQDEQTSMMEELINIPKVSKPLEIQEEPIIEIFTKKEDPIIKKVNELVIPEKIEKTEEQQEAQIEPLEVLAQMSGKYILAKGDAGLYIIDQHAAMERIRYEYYQKTLLKQNIGSQKLLIPLVFDGRQTLVHREEDVIKAFKELDINIEVLDEDTLVLRERPLYIKEDEIDEFVNKTLDYLEAHKTIREEDFRQDTLATLACHSSVRFNEHLSKIEMEKLVEDLRNAKQPLHCPHGRPTLFVVEEKDILKRFMR